MDRFLSFWSVFKETKSDGVVIGQNNGMRKNVRSFQNFYLELT